jgi:hypothetical protein
VTIVNGLQISADYGEFFFALLACLTIGSFLGCQDSSPPERWDLEPNADAVDSSGDSACQRQELPPIYQDAQRPPDGGSPYCGYAGDEHCFEGSTYRCQSGGAVKVRSDCCDVDYRRIAIEEVNNWSVTQHPSGDQCSNEAGGTEDPWKFSATFSVKNVGKTAAAPTCYSFGCVGGAEECLPTNSMIGIERAWVDAGITAFEMDFGVEAPKLQPGESVTLTTNSFMREGLNACETSLFIACWAGPGDIEGFRPYRAECTLPDDFSNEDATQTPDMSLCEEDNSAATPLRTFRASTYD